MNKPPAFQFYVDDFLGGTMHFTDAEVGLYIRLLCVQWSTGKLPCENHELSSYGKGDTNVDRVKMKFKVGKDGFLRNERMENERVKQENYRKSRSDNGKYGGRPTKPHGKHMVLKTKAQESSPSPSPSPLSTEVPAIAGEHHAFIKGWTESFKAFWGFDYKYEGRDSKSVQSLIRMGITRIDLLRIAGDAWKRGRDDRFTVGCKRSVTIHGFCDSLNEIRTELKNGNNHSQTSKPNPRNFGITIGPTNYATAKPRLQRECEEKERLAKQVAQAPNNPPPA